MNIFWLDSDLEKCAHDYCDQHVVKMITEYAQLLSTANRLCGLDQGYKISHLNHPCAKWVRQSETNWKVLRTLAHFVHNEYCCRYAYVHKAYLVIKELDIPPLPKIGMTTPPSCMPDYCKIGSVVDNYREYYIREKARFARWKHEDIPIWFLEGIKGKL